MCYTLLRHSIALGIILFSYKYIKNKELIKFIITVIIASLFHKTAIIFLIAYPIYNKLKYGVKNNIIILLSIMISILFGNQLLKIVINFLQEERFSSYADNTTSLSLTNFYIHFCILLFAQFYIKMFYEKKYVISQEIEGLLNLSTCSCVFLAFTPVLGEMYRISMFFGVFMIILLPNVIANASEDKRYKPMILYGITIIFCMYYLFFSLNNAQVVPYVWYN